MVHLASETGFEFCGIEFGYRARPAFPVQDILPEFTY
jgi:hypothetical protein